VLIAVVAGTVVGVGVIARKGLQGGRKTAVPFGPFLALGAFVAALAGDQIVGWYADKLG
jgi:leader peptidase (prepilin peptidase) / N-methyltransferase